MKTENKILYGLLILSIFALLKYVLGFETTVLIALTVTYIEK